jgi:hypothetical protein
VSTIAEAFVRIRPNTAGFAAEAETGVRSAFSRLAKIAAGAFAVKETFDFGKELVSHAADVQKQVEAIGSEFGKAGDKVIEFNEKGAASLGISAHLADQTSARFGILFKNLNIGGEQAAKMTIGFEKLAGSLSAIRGVDPAIVLKNIPLAVAGNLRSLKQMGIATDQTQLKLAAFKLGLTSSVSQALTPATRAQAIYAVATGHLSEFMAQAAAHSDDLVNRQRRLSAEWDNAKDSLGKGLLPIMSKLVGAFATVLPGAVNITRRIFQDLAADISDIAKVVGPAITPVIDSFKTLASSFKTSGLSGLLDGIKQLSPAAKIASAAAVALGAAFAVAFISVAPITATVLAIIGLGIAFREAYNRSASFREQISRLGAIFETDVVPRLREFQATIVRVFQYVANAARPAFEELKKDIGPILEDIAGIIRTFVGIAVSLWQQFGGLITKIAKNDLGAVVKIIVGAIRVIRGVFDTLSGIIHGDWHKALDGLKEIASGAFKATLAPFTAFAKNVEAIFSGMWTEVEKLFIEGVEKVVSILAKIPSVSAKIPGVGKVGFKNPFKGIDASLKETLDSIKNRGSEAPAAAGEAAAKAVHGIALRTAGAIGDSTKPVKDAAAKAAADQAAAIASMTDNLNATVKAQDAGIAKARAKVRGFGAQIAAAITQEAADVRDAVQSANQNLISVGSSLSDSIGQILDAPLQRLQQKQAALSNRQNLTRLRQSVLLPGGAKLSADPKKALAELEALSKRAGNSNRAAIQDFIGQYQQAVAAVKGDQINAVKQRTQQSINDLTDSLARGKIDLGTFRKRLLAILTRDHVSFKKAGRELGTSFADGFRDQVAGLLAQAKAITSTPGKFKGTPFSTVSVIRPLDTLTKDNKQIAALTHKKMDAQTALQTRIAKAAEKSAALSAQLAGVKVNPELASTKGKNGVGKVNDALKGTTR